MFLSYLSCYPVFKSQRYHWVCVFLLSVVLVCLQVSKVSLGLCFSLLSVMLACLQVSKVSLGLCVSLLCIMLVCLQVSKVSLGLCVSLLCIMLVCLQVSKVSLGLCFPPICHAIPSSSLRGIIGSVCFSPIWNASLSSSLKGIIGSVCFSLMYHASLSSSLKGIIGSVCFSLVCHAIPSSNLKAIKVYHQCLSPLPWSSNFQRSLSWVTPTRAAILLSLLLHVSLGFTLWFQLQYLSGDVSLDVLSSEYMCTNNLLYVHLSFSLSLVFITNSDLSLNFLGNSQAVVDENSNTVLLYVNQRKQAQIMYK